MSSRRVASKTQSGNTTSKDDNEHTVMSITMSKRTLDAFFKSSGSSSRSPNTSVKKPKENNTTATETSNEAINDDTAAKPGSDAIIPPDRHPSYPFPVSQLPSHISVGLEFTTPGRQPRIINNQPHLDLLYYEPYIPQPTASEYFRFLRQELPFYRVKYTIKRGPIETVINTPRFTTAFGVDSTSYFSEKNNGDDTDTCTKTLLDSKTHRPIPKDRYKCAPRPIPTCLDVLRKQVEDALSSHNGVTYNCVLVNYYASGDDSISYHSDDERFLGANPNIASLTLGAKRDFLMKHKSPADGGAGVPPRETLKLPLASGDMIVMKGETQSNWLHSIPKRKWEGSGGRINITLRKALVIGGTENYYRYNVGDESTYRWDEARKEMRIIT